MSSEQVTNVKVGACSVKFGGVNLGFTKGGVTFDFKSTYVDVTADKYGDTVLDKALKMQEAIVTVNLEEAQVARLKEAMPLGTEIGDDELLTFGSQAGARLLSLAKQLVLHPVANAANDLSEDIVLHKAVSIGDISLNFEADNVRVFKVQFLALIDTTKSNGNLLGFVGDSTAS